jgi:hypothetical protein
MCNRIYEVSLANVINMEQGLVKQDWGLEKGQVDAVCVGHERN